jgi:iron complex transport system substrate-binding protein
MKIRPASHIASIVLLLALVSVATLPAAGEDGYPKTIVDSANRTITMEKPAERVVPIVAWSYEPLYILGAEEKIVGVEKGSHSQYSWLPGLEDKPIIGTYKEPDFEKIIELNPDLVIVQPAYLQKVDEKLSPLGITVVNLPFNTQESFDRELMTLAEMLGSEEEGRAEEFLSWKQSSIDSLRGKTEEIDPRVKVYGEWSDTPWMTGSKASGMHDVITMAGGYNIAESLNPEGDPSGRYPTVDPEWVVSENPEVVIFPAFDYFTGYYFVNSTDSISYLEEAMSREGLSSTDAAKNGRIYIIDAYLVEAVRGFIGAHYLAKWFYPEEFGDLDPEAIHREYFEEWLGVPYQGIWAYPQASA